MSIWILQKSASTLNQFQVGSANIDARSGRKAKHTTMGTRDRILLIEFVSSVTLRTTTAHRLLFQSLVPFQYGVPSSKYLNPTYWNHKRIHWLVYWRATSLILTVPLTSSSKHVGSFLYCISTQITSNFRYPLSPALAPALRIPETVVRTLHKSQVCCWKASSWCHTHALLVAWSILQVIPLLFQTNNSLTPLADILLGSTLPLHPYLTDHPSLFLRLIVDGIVCGEMPLHNDDLATGIWETNSGLRV